MTPIRQLGLVVHPTRSLEEVLAELSGWAAERCALGQVQISGQTRQVADAVAVEDCDLIVALGGDGTTLTALHAGAPSSKAVLGVACGSVGALTSVEADRTIEALQKVEEGSWSALELPGAEITGASDRVEIAINDLTVIRDGPGQLLVSVVVDDVLYARVAGDGLVVATALGSSAYTMAAGGPILAPGVDGLAVTPLAPHGGSIPPLVVGPGSRIAPTMDPGHGGVRREIDGRLASLDGEVLTVRALARYATLVRLADQEPRLSSLRQRGLVVDSPRVLVRDAARPAAALIPLHDRRMGFFRPARAVLQLHSEALARGLAYTGPGRPLDLDHGGPRRDRRDHPRHRPRHRDRRLARHDRARLGAR